ncbi:MAG: hypothetical protein UY87_C0065G0007 [Candidatus Peribacteria bacterium GW2011_GWC2_54_8]|nr:MAG: hypothetical protein UY87_C0065G0007 [Candidatus Peribacteria bacterium GW2011_GWC2_54_8]
MLIGTMGYGIIINFVILAIMDGNQCIEGPCDPYIFLLFLSLVLGFLLSLLIERFSSKAV